MLFGNKPLDLLTTTSDQKRLKKFAVSSFVVVSNNSFSKKVQLFELTFKLYCSKAMHYFSNLAFNRLPDRSRIQYYIIRLCLNLWFLYISQITKAKQKKGILCTHAITGTHVCIWTEQHVINIWPQYMFTYMCIHAVYDLSYSILCAQLYCDFLY